MEGQLLGCKGRLQSPTGLHAKQLRCRPQQTCTGASAGGRRSPASSPCTRAMPPSSAACRHEAVDAT